MAYTKQTWNDLPNTTTPVTATRLNHIEDGVYDANKLRGGLIAVGTIWTDSVSEQMAQAAMVGWSDITSTRNHNERNFISGILEYNSTSKTYIVHTKGVVGYVKTYMTISGMGATNTSGIWFAGKNKDTLPTGVSTMENNISTGGLICFQKGTSYSGASNELDYLVEATGDVSFTINPLWEPYQGPITPGSSGTRCLLKVEVYAKYE